MTFPRSHNQQVASDHRLSAAINPNAWGDEQAEGRASAGSEAGVGLVSSKNTRRKSSKTRAAGTEQQGTVVRASQAPEYRVPHAGRGKDFGFYSQCKGKPRDNPDQA